MRWIAATAVVLLLMPGCKPSQKEIAALQERVTQLESSGRELRAEVDALGSEQRQRASDGDQATIERQEMREQAEDLQTRVAALEDAGRPTPTPVRAGRLDPATTYQVLIGRSHARGPDTALVTIVQFADFQCPFCARVQGTLDQLREKYGADLRIVFKHKPLAMHPRAMPAALAAEAAAEQGKFWEMHDLLFKNQRALTEADLRGYAKKLRLNKKKWDRDRKKKQLQARVDEENGQSDRLGVSGTPAFFVNGRPLSGAQPLENFSQLIDAELARAERLVAGGIPRSQVYETLMADAVRPGS